MTKPWMGGALTALALTIQARAAVTAYINPAGEFAPYAGAPGGLVSWGMDFDVNAPITVTALGSFDFDQNGVFNHDVTIAIFNRDTQSAVGSSLTFTTASPGTLAGGSRFKALGDGISLAAGFHGSIVAWGITELGSGGESLVDESNQGSPAWSLDTGGGMISFVGTSRLDTVPTAGITYPTIPDTFVTHAAFTPNQYMAGTFQFVPEPSSAVLWLSGMAALGWRCRRRRDVDQTRACRVAL